MKLLLVYPNLPLMMSPSIAMAIFNAIGKKKNCTVEIFETTQYSDQYANKHIRSTEVGANRPNKEEEIKDMFYIKSTDSIIPDFLEKVKTFEPDLILMSVQEDVWYMAKLLLESIKDFDIPHIIGGIFPTAAPEIVIKNPFVKAICLHEGERALSDAIDTLQQGSTIEDVKGLWVKTIDGVVKKNAPQPLCDISEITPDFSCFKGQRWNRPMGGRLFKRAVSMETYRGCPYNCSYCNSPFTRNFSKINNSGNYMRRKSADIVERDLLYYKDLYNPDLIMFQDDSFLARPKKEIFDFCKMWSKYKIPFWMNTRIENCTPDVLEALKEAGIYRMTFGLESGNEEYRKKYLKRNVSNELYYKHIDYINESNIPYSLNVIIGMPYETRQLVLDTAEFVHNSKGYDSLSVSMLQLYHGTELRNVAINAGFMDPNHINSDSKNDIGGFLDSWILKMPAPYLQPNDVEQLVKTFSLYAYYDKSAWPLIKKAETDDQLYSELLENYKKDFFTDFQSGGKDRIEKLYCANHDPTSTYHFEEIKP